MAPHWGDYLARRFRKEQGMGPRAPCAQNVLGRQKRREAPGGSWVIKAAGNVAQKDTEVGPRFLSS